MGDDYRMVIRRHGGPEVLEREGFPAPSAGRGEIVVRQAAIGLNFIDIYHREGLYPLDLPSALGSEAAGRVEAVGDDVDGFAAGDRVAYATGPIGAYASVRAIPAEHVVPLPAGIDEATAAAAMLKGLTADYLVGRCGKVQAGQHVLVHAAGGGVGSILVQWLKALDAIVIAHAGSAEKASRAKALGADHVLHGSFDGLAEQVRGLTGGGGVELVLDGVGQASWAASLASVAPLGLLVSYGNASGPVPPFSPLELARAGSIFVTRPVLAHYAATAEDRRAAAARLFSMIEQGAVKIDIGARFALADAARAQQALSDRQTTGSTILLP